MANNLPRPMLFFYINRLDSLKTLLGMGIIILHFFLPQTHYCMYKSTKAYSFFFFLFQIDLIDCML